MKFYLSLLIVCLMAFGQNKLSSEQWQADLRFLQETVNNDYRSLFRKVSQSEFNRLANDLNDRIPKLDEDQIKVAFAELIARFGYGHTALGLYSWRKNPLVGFTQMPYNLYRFSDGVYVQGVHKDYKKALGAKVIKVGNLSTEDALAAVKPVVSAENDQFYYAFGLHYLGIPQILKAKQVSDSKEEVTLTLKKDGRQFEMTFKSRPTNAFPGDLGLINTQGDWLDARSYDKTPMWLKHLEKNYYYEYIPKHRTVYVRQSHVFNDGNETIAQFYNRIFTFIDNNDVEKMIIDLRLNGGGENGNNKAVITGLIKSEKINQTGRLFVVIGRRTFSAAQNLVNEMENYTNAIFVGEPTAENVNFMGDARTVTLPNSKLAVRLSFRWWQDKFSDDNRQWTAPHVPVQLSFADYKNNIDPIIPAIHMAADLEQKLMALTAIEDTKSASQQLTDFAKDKRYEFYNFEAKINAMAYRFVSNSDMPQALKLFKLNNTLYPKSANTWDSLAEGYWRSGNTSKAKELYRKAIELDPNGRVGEHSRRMIDRINSGNY